MKFTHAIIDNQISYNGMVICIMNMSYKSKHIDFMFYKIYHIGSRLLS